ncbi:MAG: TolB family protein, partial [Candidatus Bipolaricaulota bacterium]
MKKRFILLALLIGGLALFLSGCSMFDQGPEIQKWQPDTSPDGESIVFSSKVGGNFQLFWMDRESGERTQITDNEYDDWGPDWGPEGERIVFVSQRNDNTDIYSVDVDGDNEKRLTEDSGQDVNPRWNGTTEVVFNSDRTDSWEIYVISIADGEIE